MRPRQALCSAICLCGIIACSTPAVGQAPGAGSEATAAQVTTDVGGANVFAGVRLWVNRWEIGGAQTIPVVTPANPNTILLQGVVVKTLSSTEVVPIPFVGVKVGNFVGSASYFVRSNYDSRDELLGTVKRDEFDVSLGYAVVPSIILSVAYKHAYQSKLSGQISPSSATIDGVLLGASASAPLVDKLSLYGNVAYGIAREKSDIPDANGDTRYNGSYLIGEVGVAYAVYQGAPGTLMKNVALTLGYRAQSFTVKSIGLGTYIAGSPPVLIDVQHKDIQTTTNGFVLGVVGNF